VDLTGPSAERQLAVTRQSADNGSLGGVDPHQRAPVQPDPFGGLLGAAGEAVDEVRLHLHHVLGGQRPDVLGHVG
jgi:hypothetical protein